MLFTLFMSDFSAKHISTGICMLKDTFTDNASNAYHDLEAAHASVTTKGFMCTGDDKPGMGMGSTAVPDIWSPHK